MTAAAGVALVETQGIQEWQSGRAVRPTWTKCVPWKRRCRNGREEEEGEEGGEAEGREGRQGLAGEGQAQGGEGTGDHYSG